MQRRKFIKKSATLMSALPVINIGNPALFHIISSMETFRTSIGKFSCTIFQDLTFKYRAADFFINSNPEDLNKALNKYNIQPDNIPSPFTPVLIQQDDKKILIDTGVGFSEKPVDVRGRSVLFHGKLQQLLQQESIKQQDVTDVIITHFHPDHVGGNFNDHGHLNFPNAIFHLHEDEWNYWHSSQSNNQPAEFKYFIEKNITSLKEFNLNL